MFLVRCADCGSRLIQPVDVVGPMDGSSIVTRYCPDCDRQDAVVADDLAIQVWLRRDERTRVWIDTIANLLAASVADDQRAPAQSGGAGATTSSPFPI